MNWLIEFKSGDGLSVKELLLYGSDKCPPTRLCRPVHLRRQLTTEIYSQEFFVERTYELVEFDSYKYTATYEEV
jgi:hypothetical protein